VNVLSPCLLTPWGSGLLARTPFLLVPCGLWGVVTNGWIIYSFSIIIIINYYLFPFLFPSINSYFYFHKDLLGFIFLCDWRAFPSLFARHFEKWNAHPSGH